MRYKILRLASAAFAILLVACHEQSEYLFGADAPLVEISADAENEGNFTPEAQTGYALLRSNARWKAESLSEWLTCNTTAGEYNDTIYFSMPENKGDTRIGKIVVRNTIGEERLDTLTVRQQCAVSFIPDGYKIKIESDDLKAPLSGESFAEVKFEVNSPTAWRAFTKATDGWSTVITKKGETSGSGSLIVTENETVVPRSMYIYVQSVEFPTLKDSILLTQSARPLKLEIISPTNKKIMLDGAESQFIFSVNGDGKWKIEDAPGWVELEKTEYEGNANVFVKVSATGTERTAQLTIRSLVQTDKTDVLTIEQKNIPDGRLKDSLALVAIYQATKGENWKYTWKPELPLSDSNWPGVLFDTVDGELRVVDLSLLDYNMEGSLPNEIGWLTEIIKIKLQRNKLTGPLPASINRLTNLTHLYITSNQFSGEFPDIPNLQKLTWIEMEFNRFTGEFPPVFSLLPKLSILKVKYNNFDPNTCVPARFGGWKLSLYINPQRATHADAKTDYNLRDCTE